MKKSYVKPQVYFENFQLSASIAAQCDIRNPLHAQNLCALEDRSFMLDGICDYPPDETSSKPCYDIPTSGNKIFNSR